LILVLKQSSFELLCTGSLFFGFQPKFFVSRIQSFVFFDGLSEAPLKILATGFGEHALLVGGLDFRLQLIDLVEERSALPSVLSSFDR